MVAVVAAPLGELGAFCGAVVNVLVGVNLAAAATARMSQDADPRLTAAVQPLVFAAVSLPLSVQRWQRVSR